MDFDVEKRFQALSDFLGSTIHHLEAILASLEDLDDVISELNQIGEDE